MKEKLRIGIIGTGGISHCHMAGYKEIDNVEVVAACDINEERARKFGAEYGIGKVYTDYNEMLRSEEMDGVSVCTWNCAHAEAAVAALNAGKNVICEKPMAMNTAEAIKMKEAADRAGKTLMIGFVKRFSTATEICLDFINKGYLGEIYYAKVSYMRRRGNPGGWFADVSRSGGGPLIDLGVHFIDQVRYLMGKPRAVSVSAVTFNKIGMGYDIKGMDRYKASDYDSYCDVEDMVSAIVRFDNGAALVIDTSFSINTKDDGGNLELFGSKAGVKFEPNLEIYTEMENYLTDITVRYNKEQDSFLNMFKKEIRNFAECIEGKAECRNPAQDGIEVMKILDAAYASAKAGKEAYIL
jgi:predicted dehydrogenase